MSQDYRKLNRASWDERAPAHAASPDYRIAELVADPAYLSGVVRFDLPRLGDVRGQRGIHLQCHIGTDTVSLARLGAHMTGLDFSPAALAEGRALAERLGLDVTFVESELYDAPNAVDPGTFDFVYTGIGALCWLPDVSRWATVVASLLRPGGRLFIREQHPVLWALDDTCTDRLVIGYSYFEQAEPLVVDEPGTYVATDTVFEHNVTHEWNHGLSQIVTALMQAGLQLTMLEEHDSVPWEALPGQMQCDEHGEWRLIDRPWRLPASYTLQAARV